MKEYFTNKKIIKEIKEKRREYARDNECQNIIPNEGTCIDSGALKCPVCQQRNLFYSAIKNLSHRQSSILRIVRGLVK